MSVKRERLQVIYDILKAIAEKNGKIKWTHVLYKANLSHVMLEDYMKDLKEKEFVHEHENKEGRTFSLTQKGFDYINRYKLIVEFTDSFGLN